MAKLTLTNLSNLNNSTTVVNTINNNNTAIDTAIENTLSRDGTTPNAMGANLDMNGWHILNLPIPSADTDPIRKIDLTNVSQVTNLVHTASSTSNTIGLGAKTFTVPSGLGLFAGQYLIIQDSASTANYMVGRVTSYSGTTLVFNSISSAGSGTKTNWTIDLSGPQGPVTVSYDTVTNAAVSTIDPTISFLQMSGYYTVGDGGNGLYKRVLVTPAHGGYFTSVGGAIWELTCNPVTPEMFGCKGDGLTDDYANMQKVFVYNKLRSGGVVQMTPNKRYRVVINAATTPNFGLVLEDNNTVYMNGAYVSFEMVAFCSGFRMCSHTRLYGPGTVSLDVATGQPDDYYQNLCHTPIAIGEYLGLGGTVGSPSRFISPTDIIIDGVTVNHTASLNHNCEGIGINGGGSEITIKNCIFTSNAFTSIVIGADWAYLGTLDSGNIALSRVNYDAGTAYSVHPHNLHIVNNKIGTMSLPYVIHAGSPWGSHGIRLSGVYNTTVEGNDVDSVTYVGVFVTGGDLSFEFAPTAIRLNAMRNIIIRDNNIKSSFGYGMQWDAFPDNVYDAVVNPVNPSYPYAPIGYSDGYPTNAEISNNKFFFPPTGATLEGMLIRYTKGLDIKDNIISGFLTGIRLSNGCTLINIHKNEIYLNTNAGIYGGDSTTPSKSVSIKDNSIYRNCLSGSSVLANIYMDYAQDATVDGNTVGFGEDQALNGVVVTDTCVRVSVINNNVLAIKAGGTAYKLPTSNATGLEAIWVFRDNYFTGVGAGTYISGLNLLPYRRDLSVAIPGTFIKHVINSRGVLASDITPTYGTWAVGSTCENLDSVSAQTYKSKCTVAGSPGTWKATAIVS